MGRVEVLGAWTAWPNCAGSETWPHVGLSSLPASDLGALTGGPGPDLRHVGDGLQREASSFLGSIEHTIPFGHGQ